VRATRWLSLLLTAFVVSPASSGEAATTGVVLLEGAVDERPDAAFANLVRVDFVGCEDLGDQDCGRLANFRFEYAWESAEHLEARLRRESSTTDVSLRWANFQTDSMGRAGLPLPSDVDGTNVLHVRLQERGWDWFTFPGAIHPGTLDGAAAFELQTNTRNQRVTLVREDRGATRRSP
jgi:hypothetical protein